MDEKEIGTPDKYPEHTFEVGHSRRRAYLITAENEEDKNAWVEMFKVCCRKASGKSVFELSVSILNSFLQLHLYRQESVNFSDVLTGEKHFYFICCSLKCLIFIQPGKLVRCTHHHHWKGEVRLLIEIEKSTFSRRLV